MTLPTKGLSYDKRLARLVKRAEERYKRRVAAVDWFWHWTLKKWARPPYAGSRVSFEVGRAVPVFATFRPRITRYKHLDGTEVRIMSQHICYEDCLDLADQAYALLARLERAAAT